MPSPCLNEEQVRRHMKAMKGNDYNVGLKTEKARIKAFLSYCKHLASGLPKQGWYYLDDDLNHCSHWTMETKIKNKEFSSILFNQARSESFLRWFKKAERIVDGEGKGGSYPTLQLVMRNMFEDLGWDKDAMNQTSDVRIWLKSPGEKE